MGSFYHNLTLTRRQAGMFKICLISLGILFGVYFPKSLKKVQWIRWILFFGLGIYILIVYLGQ